MSVNPYSPPTADLADPPRPPWAPAKAMLLGLAIDIGGSFLVGMVLGTVYAVSLAMGGMEAAEITTALASLPPESWVFVVGTLVGGAFSVLGGAVCARLSRRLDYRLGFIQAGISAASGLLLTFSQHSLALNLGLTILTFSAVLFGTKLGRTQPAAVGV